MKGKGRGASCGTTATSRASSQAASSLTRRAPSRISPRCGASTRVSSRSSDVLPALFGPITPKTSPRSTANDSPGNANARSRRCAGRA